jgi:hypothetical protein
MHTLVSWAAKLAPEWNGVVAECEGKKTICQAWVNCGSDNTAPRRSEGDECGAQASSWQA